MRILPYQVSPETVSGVLVAFIDVGAIKGAQEELLTEKQDLRARVRELDLLYGISKIVEEHGASLQDVARERR